MEICRNGVFFSIIRRLFYFNHTYRAHLRLNSRTIKAYMLFPVMKENLSNAAKVISYKFQPINQKRNLNILQKFVTSSPSPMCELSCEKKPELNDDVIRDLWLM